ncbi:MAG: SDR family oxidoreductase, partial [Ruthenibacterium sp.]
MKLEHKIALVTGAGSGIGRQTAITFSKEGATVVLCDISAKAVAETEREITAAGNAALALQMDVTSEADWQRVATAVQEKFGMLHVFFNNAGILICKSIEELSLEEWNREMAVNCTGAFLGIKYMAPLLVASGNGSIINTASDASIMGFVNHAAYGASKAGIAMLSQVAAAEYRNKHVRSNSIHPACCATNMLAGQAADIEHDPAFFTPMGRILYPQDIANLVLFLASDDSSAI